MSALECIEKRARADSWWIRWRLTFRPWQIAYGPQGEELFRFKELNGKTYYLGM